MRSRTRDWSSRAQERADQARREDDAFWSGPTYFHGATNRNGWERAARKEAREKAERKTRDTDTPPRQDPFDQNTEGFRPEAENGNEQQEARGKAEKDKREDDGCWRKPPSPQQPDQDWSDKVQKEYQERLERVKRAKRERSDRRKAEKEQSEIDWPAKLTLLLLKIISIQVEIEETRVKLDKSRWAMKACDSQSDSFSIETLV